MWLRNIGSLYNKNKFELNPTIFTKHIKVKIVDPKTDGLGEKHFVTNQLSPTKMGTYLFLGHLTKSHACVARVFLGSANFMLT